MAEPSKDTDQSMEDILQSIKRIIADEESEPAADSGSDVLELTELLAEDVAPPSSAAPDVQTMSIDDIMAMPIHDEAPVEAVTVEPEPEIPATPTPVAAPEPVAAAPTPPATDALMSDATVAESVAALHALAHAPEPISAIGGSPAFRSGTTVEDLVMEALRPMLKDWLDSNLPAMVKALVEKEIRRLSA